MPLPCYELTYLSVTTCMSGTPASPPTRRSFQLPAVPSAAPMVVTATSYRVVPTGTNSSTAMFRMFTPSTAYGAALGTLSSLITRAARIRTTRSPHFAQRHTSPLRVTALSLTWRAAPTRPAWKTARCSPPVSGSSCNVYSDGMVFRRGFSLPDPSFTATNPSSACHGLVS